MLLLMIPMLILTLPGFIVGFLCKATECGLKAGQKAFVDIHKYIIAKRSK